MTPEVRKPMYLNHIPEYEDVVGTGARFAKHVGERMKAEGIAPGLAHRNADKAPSDLAAE